MVVCVACGTMDAKRGDSCRSSGAVYAMATHNDVDRATGKTANSMPFNCQWTLHTSSRTPLAPCPVVPPPPHPRDRPPSEGETEKEIVNVSYNCSGGNATRGKRGSPSCRTPHRIEPSPTYCEPGAVQAKRTSSPSFPTSGAALTSPNRKCSHCCTRVTEMEGGRKSGA